MYRQLGWASEANRQDAKVAKDVGKGAKEIDRHAPEAGEWKTYDIKSRRQG